MFDWNWTHTVCLGLGVLLSLVIDIAASRMLGLIDALFGDTKQEVTIAISIEGDEG